MEEHKVHKESCLRTVKERKSNTHVRGLSRSWQVDTAPDQGPRRELLKGGAMMA